MAGVNGLWSSVLVCCLFVVGLTKCVTPYTPNLTTNIDESLVVEAYIIAPTGSSIKISRIKGLQDDGDYNRVSNAQVTIISDRGDIIATARERESGTGEYVIDNPLAFVAGTMYALDIVVGSEHIQSLFEEPLITPEIDELDWATKSDGYELDILLSTHDPLQKTECYLWRYDEEWEYTARIPVSERWDPNRRDVFPNTPTDNVYYCWDKSPYASLIFEDVRALRDGILKDKVIITHKSGGTRFSVLYSILVKQYAIPYEAYKYYENLEKNATSTGGLFAPQPTDLKGNIVNLTNPDESVIGYALIAKETSKRLYIDVMDVIRMKEPIGERCLDVTSRFRSPEEAYRDGWGIYEYIDGSYTYLRRECLDCRLLGGSKKKPDFWPTGHL